MIEEIKMPGKGAPITALWQPLARLVSFANALRNLRFEEGRDWDFDVTSANVVIRHKPGGGAVAAAVAKHPWQPYPAPYLGTGTPPADQPLRFQLYPGFVNGGLPANWETQFLAPPSCAAGFFVWVVAPWTAGVGMTSLRYDSGETLPVSALGDQETGAPPAVAYQPLCFVTSTATGIDKFYPLVRVSLSLETYVSEITCSTAVNSLRFRGLGSP